MLDPRRRWAEIGEKPEYAGLVSFGALPYSENPADLAGIDVAILGAPLDELVSGRPGARYGPRAIRIASTQGGRHLEARIDAESELRVLDFGDAGVVPSEPERSHGAIERTVEAILAAGATPLVLGGDHSVSEPAIRACARARGPVGLVHFDAHTDTAQECFGAARSHGTIMFQLVRARAVDPTRYVQVGLRGYWPDESVLAWQAEQGITSFLMRDVRERGVDQVLAETLARVGSGPVYLTVDVDVLDPAFAPGTGTPEPGGMASFELLSACRQLASAVELVGADVVEVSPLAELGDITALAGARIAQEILTGIALRHRTRSTTATPVTPSEAQTTRLLPAQIDV